MGPPQPPGPGALRLLLLLLLPLLPADAVEGECGRERGRGGAAAAPGRAPRSVRLPACLPAARGEGGAAWRAAERGWRSEVGRGHGMPPAPPPPLPPSSSGQPHRPACGSERGVQRALGGRLAWLGSGERMGEPPAGHGQARQDPSGGGEEAARTRSAATWLFPERGLGAAGLRGQAVVVGAGRDARDAGAMGSPVDGGVCVRERTALTQRRG